MQEDGYISAGDQRLHYLKYGDGPSLLLAFHGYGEDARSFRMTAPLLEPQYTLISVNLPHHGGSHWPDHVALEKETLRAFVAGLLQQTGREKTSLIGYSIGGRVCLNIMELMPECIERVVLVAPDGLALNRLYYFATHTAAGRYLFRHFLRGGKKYNSIINGLYNFNLIDPSRYKFAMRYLDNEDQRQLLLHVWPAMRMLLPDIRIVKEHIRRYHIPVDIFMGRYDHVIPLKQARRFVKGMPAHVRLHVLEKGHVMLDSDSVQKMADCLLWK